MICTNCKRELKDNHLYCGYCGAAQKPSVNIIIDGRKDKQIKYLINRVCHFEKINVIFSVILLGFIIAGIILLKIRISDIISKSKEFSSVLAQLNAKYGYAKEGLGLSYLYREINFILVLVRSILLAVTSGYVTLSSLFFLLFNVNILGLRHKYKEDFYYKKPLRFIKIAFFAVKVSLVVIGILAVLWLALIITGLILL